MTDVATLVLSPTFFPTITLSPTTKYEDEGFYHNNQKYWEDTKFNPTVAPTLTPNTASLATDVELVLSPTYFPTTTFSPTTTNKDEGFDDDKQNWEDFIQNTIGDNPCQWYQKVCFSTALPFSHHPPGSVTLLYVPFICRGNAI